MKTPSINEPNLTENVERMLKMECFTTDVVQMSKDSNALFHNAL